MGRHALPLYSPLRPIPVLSSIEKGRVIASRLRAPERVSRAHARRMLNLVIVEGSMRRPEGIVHLRNAHPMTLLRAPSVLPL
jgi:hypothetical protein